MACAQQNNAQSQIIYTSNKEKQKSMNRGKKKKKHLHPEEEAKVINNGSCYSYIHIRAISSACICTSNLDKENTSVYFC